jgi:hypothetical protein
MTADDATWPDLVPPLSAPRAALAAAWPVVLDPAQYERAARLGLAGKLGPMQFEAVLWRGARFEPAQHFEDQRGAEIAFLFPAFDAESEIADVVAWVPETGKTATLLGEIGTLGLDAMWEHRLTPPIVHETLLGWLTAPEDGFFIVDAKLAARELDGVVIAAVDRDAALRLRARLAPHCTRAPNIVVPRMAA